jgi:hypothetical protein
MGRIFSFILAAIGFGLIALGLWVTLAFDKVADASGNTVIRRHPAAEAGDKFVIAGSLCFIGAAINSRGTRPPSA